MRAVGLGIAILLASSVGCAHRSLETVEVDGGLLATLRPVESIPSLGGLVVRRPPPDDQHVRERSTLPHRLCRHRQPTVHQQRAPTPGTAIVEPLPPVHA